MTHGQSTWVECDRCHARQVFDTLLGAQDAGWLTITTRVIGSAFTHASATEEDVCPQCSAEPTEKEGA